MQKQIAANTALSARLYGTKAPHLSGKRRRAKSPLIIVYCCVILFANVSRPAFALEPSPRDTRASDGRHSSISATVQLEMFSTPPSTFGIDILSLTVGKRETMPLKIRMLVRKTLTLNLNETLRDETRF